LVANVQHDSRFHFDRPFAPLDVLLCWAALIVEGDDDALGWAAPGW
jgi:hypothetical protein